LAGTTGLFEEVSGEGEEGVGAGRGGRGVAMRGGDDDDNDDDDSPAAHCIFCSSALHRVKATIFSWGYPCYT
jgi:hypothetical protein